MCFSATASFSASALLIGGGMYATARSAKDDPPKLVFAAYPLAFGIQQMLEGIVWLQLGSHAAPNHAALGFLFFSHFFWPAWAPFSAWWFERDRGQRARSRLLAAFALAGLLLGALLYVPLWQHGWFDPEVKDGHIAYQTTVVFDVLFPEYVPRTIYGLVVVGSLILSSVLAAKLLGALLIASITAAVLGYPEESFVSVWCFFAAVISLFVVIWIACSSRASAAHRNSALHHP